MSAAVSSVMPVFHGAGYNFAYRVSRYEDATGPTRRNCADASLLQAEGKISSVYLAPISAKDGSLDVGSDPGYRLVSKGYILGSVTPLSVGKCFSGQISWSSTDVRSDSLYASGSGTIATYQVSGAYESAINQDSRFSFGFQLSRFNTKATKVLPFSSGTIESAYAAHSALASAKYVYQGAASDSLQLTYFCGFDIFHHRSSSYTEKGDSPLALAVRARDHTRTNLNIGVALDKSVSDALSVGMSLAGSQVLSSRTDRLEASFQSQPQSSFVVVPVRRPRSSLDIGFNAAYAPKTNSRLVFSYRSSQSATSRSWVFGISGTVRF